MAKKIGFMDKIGNDGFGNLSVSDKLKKVFNKLKNNLILIFAVIILVDIFSLFNLHSIYNIYYEQNTQQGEIRITIQALAKYYLWAINAEEESDRNDQMTGADEKIQEMKDVIKAFWGSEGQKQLEVRCFPDARSPATTSSTKPSTKSSPSTA